MNVPAISPHELAELWQQGKKFDLIDVRARAEFREMHVAHARNVPLEKLNPTALVQPGNGDGPVYMICRSGSRGRQACEKLLSAGFTNVANVEGGTLACLDSSLPMVRGKKTMSLERQVRIAAGLLVLIGTTLGFFIHPAFLGLSAFVGAGLIFAGVTDTCGMGLLLARMPWNQVKDAAGPCAVG